MKHFILGALLALTTPFTLASTSTGIITEKTEMLCPARDILFFGQNEDHDRFYVLCDKTDTIDLIVNVNGVSRYITYQLDEVGMVDEEVNVNYKLTGFYVEQKGRNVGYLLARSVDEDGPYGEFQIWRNGKLSTVTNLVNENLIDNSPVSGLPKIQFNQEQ